MEGINNNNFLNQLDELIALFEKLRVKATKEGVILENDPLYKNFELLAGNYKLIKNNIPPDLIEDMGAPIKDMITQMVVQLRKELGEEIINENKEGSMQDELDKIDKLLASNDLSEDEINRLLDKRTDLS